MEGSGSLWYYITPPPEGLLVNSEDYENDRFMDLKINIADMSEVSVSTNAIIPQDLAMNVMEYGVVEEKYWYWSEAGSAAYLSTYEDPDKYDLNAKVLDLLEGNLNEIMENLSNQFKEWHNSTTMPRIDLISLGVGGMEKETTFLKKFQRRYKRELDKTHDNRLTFIPIDLSFQLMANSLKKIDKDFRRLIPHDVVVKACLTDFTSTKENEISTSKFRFITAFGIVYNAQYPEIFKSFKRIMTKHTLLLMDMDTVAGRSEEDIRSAYEDENIKRTLYAPIFSLYRASEKDEKIVDKNRNVIGNLTDFKKCSYENGDIYPAVIDSSKIDDFIVEHNLHPNSKKRIRISNDSADKTIVIIYRPSSSDVYKYSIVLGYSTRFDYDGFTEKLRKNGFDVVNVYGDKKYSSFAYFLVKLADKKSNLQVKQDSDTVIMGRTGKSTR